MQEIMATVSGANVTSTKSLIVDIDFAAKRDALVRLLRVTWQCRTISMLLSLRGANRSIATGRRHNENC
jgi:hypothetical protein